MRRPQGSLCVEALSTTVIRRKASCLSEGISKIYIEILPSLNLFLFFIRDL